jgi:hypothetical protein
MLRKIGIGPLAVLAIVAAGCGKSDVSSQQSPPPAHRDAVPSVASVDPNTVAKADGPERAVHDFLEALRTGNEEKATQLLSTVARQKTAAVNRALTPPASSTASFAIGKVEYVGDDGARVPCTWTDLDEDGQRKSDEAIWVARREAEGWRIAGVAAAVFPGEPPLLLNFEDPEEMARKQQLVREEMRRRTEASMQVNAETGENPEKALRR